jgi:hypothetical protein
MELSGERKTRRREPAPPPDGLEKDQLRAHIPGMSESQYEIFEPGDGTFAVEVHGGDGDDATMTGFASRQDAEDWVREQRRKLGIDERWPEITND